MDRCPVHDFFGVGASAGISALFVAAVLSMSNASTIFSSSDGTDYESIWVFGLERGLVGGSGVSNRTG
jgi:hypothetical protein